MTKRLQNGGNILIAALCSCDIYATLLWAISDVSIFANGFVFPGSGEDVGTATFWCNYIGTVRWCHHPATLLPHHHPVPNSPKISQYINLSSQPLTLTLTLTLTLALALTASHSGCAASMAVLALIVVERYMLLVRRKPLKVEMITKLIAGGLGSCFVSGSCPSWDSARSP